MSPARMRRTRWLAGSVVGVAVLCAGAAAVATARDDGSAPAAASAPRTPSAGSADAGFAREMAVHHQQAVEMSFVVRDRTKDEDVRRLAYDIANTQANQRGMLLGWLDLWELPKTTPAGQEPMAWMSGHGHHDEHAGGHGGGEAGFEAHDGALMPGMATRTELKALGAAEGVKAEVLFLQLMTDHHKGGVTMAEGCAELCAVPAEKRLAQGMVEAQRSELDLMADMLAARGAAPRP
ncbi:MULTISPECIES: DUF305 domain-containing protein [unclassified Streptomyces]|uniref:DUF305 domain-containing protein n=1 Tax=unclassified Streptomyces TaxID=2593676 RepID=UPI000B829352|nr:DUF305 domain-containing protein [Streptomyces sp. OspMP-M45]MYR75802.1 DUF305 domain-containing protein [Streptomyces sp. SID4925]